MAGRLFTVDSRLRKNRVTGTPEDYEYLLNNPIKNADGVKLVGALVPKTTYPVISGFNNILRVQEEIPGPTTNVVDVTITAERDYSGTELATELQTQLVSALAGFGVGDVTVAYSSDTNKLTVTNNISTTTRITIFGRATQGSAGLSTFSVTELLGLGANNVTIGTISGANTQSTTFPGQVDLSWPRYLYLDVSFSLHTAVGDRVITSTTDHTFIVHLSESNFLDVEWWTEKADFEQVIPVNGSIQNISVKWRPPDLDARALWDFSLIDHQLIFRAV